MRPIRNTFDELASQARGGDSTARESLRSQMERDMVHIVRRSLQTGRVKSTLDRKIHAEARRIGRDAGLSDFAGQEHLIRLVAQSLCASVLSNLRAAAPDVRRAEETIV